MGQTYEYENLNSDLIKICHDIIIVKVFFMVLNLSFYMKNCFWYIKGNAMYFDSIQFIISFNIFKFNDCFDISIIKINELFK